MQREVLDSPVLCLSRIKLVLTHAFHFVHPVELADLLACRSKPPERLSFQIILVNFTAGVGAIEELLALCVGRTNAHRPWCSNVTDDAYRIQVLIEYLDAIVATVTDVDVAFGIGRNGMGRIELSRHRSARSDRFHECSVLIEFRDARIVVPIGHKDIAIEIPGNIGWPGECSSSASSAADCG